MSSWNEMYEKAKLIFERDGHLNDAPNDIREWLKTERNAWRHGKLDAQQRDLLLRIRVTMNQNSTWFEHYDIAKRYYDRYGTVNVPFIYVDEQGCALGQWIHCQKQRYRMTVNPGKYKSSNAMFLLPYHKELLDKLNFAEIYKPSLQTSFPEQALFYYISRIYPDAINRYRDLGFELDLYIPSLRIGIEYDGSQYHKKHKIYLTDLEKNTLARANNITLIRIREPGLADMTDCICFHQNELSAEWYAKSIEFVFETLDKLFNTSYKNAVNIDLSRDTPEIMQSFREYGDRIWQRHYNNLLKFYQEYGHINVPSDSDNPEHVVLYYWLYRQRIARNTPEKSDSKISCTQIQKLDELGMEWDHSLVQWTLTYRKLLEYLKINNKEGLRFFHQVDDDQETKFARWLDEQRKSYAAGTLDVKCVKMLKDIGIDWELISKTEDNWSNGYAYAKRYYETYGHLLLSKEDKFEGFNLGLWVQVQRNGYNHIGNFVMPSPERIALLNQIGMCWDNLQEARFAFFLSKLKAYIDVHGVHHAIPIDFVGEQQYPLGATLHQYYRIYRSGKLDAERLIKIENLVGSFDAVVFLYKNDYEPNNRRMLDRKQRRWQGYFNQFKDLLEVSPYKNVIITDDDSMKRWCTQLIEDYNGGKLAPVYKTMVDTLHINVAHLQVRSTLNYNTWINNFAKLEVLVNNQIAPNIILTDDKELNGWIRYTIRRYQNKDLLDEQMKQMDSLPIEWDKFKIKTKLPMYMQQEEDRV